MATERPYLSTPSKTHTEISREPSQALVKTAIKDFQVFLFCFCLFKVHWLRTQPHLNELRMLPTQRHAVPRCWVPKTTKIRTISLYQVLLHQIILPVIRNMTSIFSPLLIPSVDLFRTKKSLCSPDTNWASFRSTHP